jgi:hypothetical protein
MRTPINNEYSSEQQPLHTALATNNNAALINTCCLHLPSQTIAAESHIQQANASEISLMSL